MINPNMKHEVYAQVLKVRRYPDGSLQDVIVELDNGSQIESVLGIEDDKRGVSERDIVRCEIGYRITSERYVLEQFKIVAKFKGVS